MAMRYERIAGQENEYWTVEFDVPIRVLLWSDVSY